MKKIITSLLLITSYAGLYADAPKTAGELTKALKSILERDATTWTTQEMNDIDSALQTIPEKKLRNIKTSINRYKEKEQLVKATRTGTPTTGTQTGAIPTPPPMPPSTETKTETTPSAPPAPPMPPSGDKKTITPRPGMGAILGDIMKGVQLKKTEPLTKDQKDKAKQRLEELQKKQKAGTLKPEELQELQQREIAAAMEGGVRQLKKRELSEKTLKEMLHRMKEEVHDLNDQDIMMPTRHLIPLLQDIHDTAQKLVDKGITEYQDLCKKLEVTIKKIGEINNDENLTPVKKRNAKQEEVKTIRTAIDAVVQ